MRQVGCKPRLAARAGTQLVAAAWWNHSAHQGQVIRGSSRTALSGTGGFLRRRSPWGWLAVNGTDQVTYTSVTTNPEAKMEGCSVTHMWLVRRLTSSLITGSDSQILEALAADAGPNRIHVCMKEVQEVLVGPRGAQCCSGQLPGHDAGQPLGQRVLPQ